MRIYLDVTELYPHRGGSGIPRAIREYSVHLGSIAEVICFVHFSGTFYHVSPQTISEPSSFWDEVRLAWSRARSKLRLQRPFHIWDSMMSFRLQLQCLTGAASRIKQFEAGSAIFIPSNPREAAIYETSMRRHNNGASIFSLVHDIFPLEYPNLVPAGYPEGFEQGIRTQINLSDKLICVSKRTAKSLSNYLDRLGIKKPIEPIYLGSDLKARSSPGIAIAPGPANEVPVVLSVGTVEPRKNYGYALDIVHALWGQGIDFRYVIVGRDYWPDESRKIRSSPEFGKRLDWRTDASDSELSRLYESSDVFLSTSVDEGFGLPLMEALHYGLPVVASDIEIFRETCPEAVFIPLDDATASVRILQSLLTSKDRRRTVGRTSGAMITWAESAQQMLRAMQLPMRS